MQEAILQLPPEMRAPLVVRHVAGLSHDEMAILVDSPRHGARARLHAARQQLREHLMAWPSTGTLPEADDALLQDAIDGELYYDARETRDRLMGEHPAAFARAARCGSWATC